MRSYSSEVEDALIQTQDQFVWEAPAFEQFARGPVWYFVMAIVTVFLVAYAIWTANFLFAFIIVLGALLLLLVGNKSPNKVLVQVGDNGIVYDGKLILYQAIENFAIVYHPPIVKRLIVELRTLTQPRLRLLLEDEDPVALRNYLRVYINENFDLQYEPFSDTLARLLRL